MTQLFDFDAVHLSEFMSEFMRSGDVSCREVVEAHLSRVEAINRATRSGISVYADLWREDLCLRAAEIIEAHNGARTPVDPAFDAA